MDCGEASMSCDAFSMFFKRPSILPNKSPAALVAFRSLATFLQKATLAFMSLGIELLFNNLQLKEVGPTNSVNVPWQDDLILLHQKVYLAQAHNALQQALVSDI